jgi:hypothetical protein
MTWILALLFAVIGAVLFLFGVDVGYRLGEKDTSQRLHRVFNLGNK